MISLKRSRSTNSSAASRAPGLLSCCRPAAAARPGAGGWPGFGPADRGGRRGAAAVPPYLARADVALRAGHAAGPRRRSATPRPAPEVAAVLAAQAVFVVQLRVLPAVGVDGSGAGPAGSSAQCASVRTRPHCSRRAVAAEAEHAGPAPNSTAGRAPVPVPGRGRRAGGQKCSRLSSGRRWAAMIIVDSGHVEEHRLEQAGEQRLLRVGGEQARVRYSVPGGQAVWRPGTTSALTPALRGSRPTWRRSGRVSRGRSGPMAAGRWPLVFGWRGRVSTCSAASEIPAGPEGPEVLVEALGRTAGAPGPAPPPLVQRRSPSRACQSSMMRQRGNDPTSVGPRCDASAGAESALNP